MATTKAAITVRVADLPEVKELVAKLDTARFVCGVREKELLDLKGPCSNGRCRLHFAHSGPCDIKELRP